MKTIACLLFAASMPALGADARRSIAEATTLQESSIGYVVYREPLELRPILGIPGAARMGDPIALPDGTRNVHVAPDHRAAVIETDTAVGVWALDGSNAVVWFDSPEKPEVVFSPSGSSVALRQGERARVLTGLPFSPAEARWFAIPAAATRLALSDDGSVLLASAGNELWRIDEAQSRLLPSLGEAEIGVVVFAPQSRDAVVCAGSAAWRVVDASAYVPVAPADPDAPQWTSAAVHEGTILLAAEGSNRLLRARADQSRQYVDLPAPAGRLQRLAAGTRFLYAAPAGEPAWFILFAEGQIENHFVPAIVRQGILEPLQ